MTRVSKKELDPEIKAHLYDQLVNMFVANTTRKDFAKTIFEILTPAERILLAKRIGIIHMLALEFSTYKISNTLKVSNATIARIVDEIEKGELKHTLATAKRHHARRSFLSVLEKIADFSSIGRLQQKRKQEFRRSAEVYRAGGK